VSSGKPVDLWDQPFATFGQLRAYDWLVGSASTSHLVIRPSKCRGRLPESAITIAPTSAEMHAAKRPRRGHVERGPEQGTFLLRVKGRNGSGGIFDKTVKTGTGRKLCAV
jgi:hypothetical protein